MAKVLLVEDDNNLREIFEMRLQADGFQTLSAGDGEAALVLAMKEKPDLIIADVMMPKMSGFEMLETLRGAPEMADTKVIMMTALGQAEDQARGAKLGVVKYLVKSQVTLEDFARVVREVLGATAGTSPAAGQQSPPAAAEVSQANNNKAESETPMDDPSTNPSTPPADPSAGSNPISDPAASPLGGAQSTADEQSAVNGQVNDFATGSPAAPADSSVPSTDPAAGAPTEHADVPVTPPPTDPSGSSDPTVPVPPASDGGTPAV